MLKLNNRVMSAVVTITLLSIVIDSRLAFAVAFFSMISFADFRIPRGGFKIILPLVIILMTSTFMTLTDENLTLWKITRGIFYFVQPIILVLLGVIIARSRIAWSHFLKQGFNLFLILTILQSMYAFFMIATGSTAEEVRYGNPFYSPAPLYLVVLCFGLNDWLKPHFGKKYYLLIALIAIMLSFSRTQYAITILFLAVMYARSAYESNFWRKTFSVSLKMALALFIFIQFADPVIMSKFINSGIEAFSFLNLDDLNPVSQYRSFEIFLLAQKLSLSGPIENIFGFGLAAELILPYTVSESLTEGTSIPVLHNSFGTVVLHSGFFGLFCYLYFIFLFLSYAKSMASTTNPKSPFDVKIVAWWLTIYFLVTGMVTHGLFYSYVVAFPLVLAGLLVSMKDEVSLT